MNICHKQRPALSRWERVELGISYALKGIMGFTIVMSVIVYNPFLFASGLVILIFSALPAVVGKGLRITLPVEVDFVITVFLFLHFILGEAVDYYNRFWWFDLMLHVSSGVTIGLVGFIIIYFFLYTHRITMNPSLVVLFSVSFSLSAAALWEIFEFAMDMTFNFNMQKSGLIDTMTDLIVAFLGACLVAIWSYRYLTMDEDGVIKLIVRRFIRMNVMLQIKREERKRKRTAIKRTPRRKRAQDENNVSDQPTGQP